MTEQPAALWEHLVQWQPATAAAIAQHVRALPEDWPARTFGVVRVDAALVLPPAATGEQFPDRAPEIAPYDEIASPDDCPACEESAGTCRFHAGYAAGHHEQAQAQREAVKARPDIGLREFMLWQADVDEAEDRGEEPPVLPAAPSAVQPPADPAAELLALATVLEIPRPGSALPLQLWRSYGHTDRWAICDREGRRWHREHGWVYEAQGIRDEALRDDTRYTLAEAVPLARKLADPSRVADEAQQPRPRRCPSCGHQICDGDGPCGAILSVGVITERRCACTGHGSQDDEAQQAAPPQPAPKRLLTLATPCAACTHPYNWHQGGICQAGPEENRCGCIAFAEAQQDGDQS